MNESWSGSFGQSSSLLSTLRGIIRDYSSDQLLLELLQNADDAGAKKFRVLFDKRDVYMKRNSSLLSDSMINFQGPAIYQYDDAEFSPTDFDSIRKVGDGNKKHDPTKTGQFGIGFNSCYHVTDLPMFVSGKYLVLFDPHKFYLPSLSPEVSTGQFFDLTKPDPDNFLFYQKYSDQIQPFVGIFNCTSQGYIGNDKGTLFRFPLRNEFVGSRSQIKNRNGIQEMNAIEGSVISSFLRDIACKLLFLRSVEEIEILVHNNGFDAPRQVYFSRALSDSSLSNNRSLIPRFIKSHMDRNSSVLEVNSDTIDFSSRKRDQFLLALASMQSEAHIAPKCGYFLQVNTLIDQEYFSNNERYSKNSSYVEIRENFLICSRFGSWENIEYAIKWNSMNNSYSFLPYISVGILLSRDTRLLDGKDNQYPSIVKEIESSQSGRVYCILPSRIELRSPFFLDSRWEITRDRNRLYWLMNSTSNMVDEQAVRSDWNKLLCQQLCGPTLADCLGILLSRNSEQFLCDIKVSRYYSFLNFSDVGDLNEKVSVSESIQRCMIVSMLEYLCCTGSDTSKKAIKFLPYFSRVMSLEQVCDGLMSLKLCEVEFECPRNILFLSLFQRKVLKRENASQISKLDQYGGGASQISIMSVVQSLIKLGCYISDAPISLIRPLEEIFKQSMEVCPSSIRKWLKNKNKNPVEFGLQLSSLFYDHVFDVQLKYFLDFLLEDVHLIDTRQEWKNIAIIPVYEVDGFGINGKFLDLEFLSKCGCPVLMENDPNSFVFDSFPNILEFYECILKSTTRKIYVVPFLFPALSSLMKNFGIAIGQLHTVQNILNLIGDARPSLVVREGTFELDKKVDAMCAFPTKNWLEEFWKFVDWEILNNILKSSTLEQLSSYALILTHDNRLVPLRSGYCNVKMSSSTSKILFHRRHFLFICSPSLQVTSSELTLLKNAGIFGAIFLNPLLSFSSCLCNRSSVIMPVENEKNPNLRVVNWNAFNFCQFWKFFAFELISTSSFEFQMRSWATLWDLVNPSLRIALFTYFVENISLFQSENGKDCISIVKKLPIFLRVGYPNTKLDGFTALEQFYYDKSTHCLGSLEPCSWYFPPIFDSLNGYSESESSFASLLTKDLKIVDFHSNSEAEKLFFDVLGVQNMPKEVYLANVVFKQEHWRSLSVKKRRFYLNDVRLSWEMIESKPIDQSGTTFRDFLKNQYIFWSESKFVKENMWFRASDMLDPRIFPTNHFEEGKKESFYFPPFSLFQQESDIDGTKQGSSWSYSDDVMEMWYIFFQRLGMKTFLSRHEVILWARRVSDVFQSWKKDQMARRLSFEILPISLDEEVRGLNSMISKNWKYLFLDEMTLASQDPVRKIREKDISIDEFLDQFQSLQVMFNGGMEYFRSFNDESPLIPVKNSLICIPHRRFRHALCSYMTRNIVEIDLFSAQDLMNSKLQAALQRMGAEISPTLLDILDQLVHLSMCIEDKWTIQKNETSFLTNRALLRAPWKDGVSIYDQLLCIYEELEYKLSNYQDKQMFEQFQRNILSGKKLVWTKKGRFYSASRCFEGDWIVEIPSILSSFNEVHDSLRKCPLFCKTLGIPFKISLRTIYEINHELGKEFFDGVTSLDSSTLSNFEKLFGIMIEMFHHDYQDDTSKFANDYRQLFCTDVKFPAAFFLVPDTRNILRNSRLDLYYDDAPWLSEDVGFDKSSINCCNAYLTHLMSELLEVKSLSLAVREVFEGYSSLERDNHQTYDCYFEEMEKYQQNIRSSEFHSAMRKVIGYSCRKIKDKGKIADNIKKKGESNGLATHSFDLAIFRLEYLKSAEFKLVSSIHSRWVVYSSFHFNDDFEKICYSASDSSDIWKDATVKKNRTNSQGNLSSVFLSAESKITIYLKVFPILCNSMKRSWERIWLPGLSIAIDNFLGRILIDKSLIGDLLSAYSSDEMIESLISWKIPIPGFDLKIGRTLWTTIVDLRMEPICQIFPFLEIYGKVSYLIESIEFSADKEWVDKQTFLVAMTEDYPCCSEEEVFIDKFSLKYYEKNAQGSENKAEYRIRHHSKFYQVEMIQCKIQAVMENEAVIVCSSDQDVIKCPRSILWKLIRNPWDLYSNIFVPKKLSSGALISSNNEVLHESELLPSSSFNNSGITGNHDSFVFNGNSNKLTSYLGATCQGMGTFVNDCRCIEEEFIFFLDILDAIDSFFFKFHENAEKTSDAYSNEVKQLNQLLQRFFSKMDPKWLNLSGVVQFLSEISNKLQDIQLTDLDSLLDIKCCLIKFCQIFLSLMENFRDQPNQIHGDIDIDSLFIEKIEIILQNRLNNDDLKVMTWERYVPPDQDWQRKEEHLLEILEKRYDEDQTLPLLEEEAENVDSILIELAEQSMLNGAKDQNSHIPITSLDFVDEKLNGTRIRPGFDLVRVGNFAETKDQLQDIAFFHHRLTFPEQFTAEREKLLRDCCGILREVCERVFHYDPAFVTLFYETRATSRFIRQKVMLNIAPIDEHRLRHQIVDIRKDDYAYSYFYGVLVHKLAHFFDVFHGTRHDFFSNEYRAIFMDDWISLLIDRGFDPEKICKKEYSNYHLWEVVM